MNSIKNTLLLVNGNVDNSSEYNSKQIGDQSGNYWISSNQHVTYSSDILNSDTKDFHKSIAFKENSDCVTIDGSHLFNFSDREFSIDTWVKFEENSSNISKKHIILSKWDNTGSVEDDKVFRFFYKHNVPQTTDIYYEDVFISFSSTEILINGTSLDTFEFIAGRAYRLTFSNEYVEKNIGIPETVGFSSREMVSGNIPDYSLDLDEFEYEELDNLDDLLIKNSEDLPDPDFVNFTEDVVVSDPDEDYADYMKLRYGILHSNIVEIEGGILLNLKSINYDTIDVEIEIQNLAIIGDASSFEEGESDTENEVVNLISTTKQVLYNRKSEQPTDKLVFEFNGIRGYESEYRNIKLEDEFIFKNNLYEVSEDNTFMPTNFSDLNFDQLQLDKMNPLIFNKLNDNDSKVWKSKRGIIIYPKFYDYEEFYTSRTNLNVSTDEETSDKLNKFEYEKYLNKNVDQRFLFLPTISVDETTGYVQFLESDNQSPSSLSESIADGVDIIEELTYISSNTCHYTFDYSFTSDKDIIVSFYTKDGVGGYTWKENVTLSTGDLTTITDNVDDFIKDAVVNADETESTEITDEEFLDIDSQSNSEYTKTENNSLYSGRYTSSHPIKNYTLDKITVFVTQPSKNWGDRTAFDSYEVTDSNEYVIDAMDITDYISSTMKYEVETDDLIDGNWHHLYFGRVGLTTTDEQTGNERVVFGVDGNFTDFNTSYEENTSFPYLKFSNDNSSRVVKLTSIQPFYEAITGKTPYEKFLNQSFVKIGSDNQSESGNLLGKIDSLRVNEFLTFETSQQLKEYVDRKTQPECWMYTSDSNNYAIYDENTKYNLSGRDGMFGVDLIDVIRYTHIPTNKFEALKHEMGSVSYIKKFVEPDYDNLTEVEKTEVVNSWRWRLKFIIPVNESIKTKKTVELQLDYANEYLEKEILNG